MVLGLTIFVAVVLAELVSTLITATYVTISAKRKYAKQQAYFETVEARLRAEAATDAASNDAAEAAE